jgi:hypothetical protein
LYSQAATSSSGLAHLRSLRTEQVLEFLEVVLELALHIPESRQYLLVRLNLELQDVDLVLYRRCGADLRWKWQSRAAAFTRPAISEAAIFLRLGGSLDHQGLIFRNTMTPSGMDPFYHRRRRARTEKAEEL